MSLDEAFDHMDDATKEALMIKSFVSEEVKQYYMSMARYEPEIHHLLENLLHGGCIQIDDQFGAVCVIKQFLMHILGNLDKS
jgi:hypothetical protein